MSNSNSLDLLSAVLSESGLTNSDVKPSTSRPSSTVAPMSNSSSVDVIIEGSSKVSSLKLIS